ncbi:helix-turn-helix transcriptional regulator [Stigmatella erecta]|uniref:AraC-type DNA-binding protein n=1 Tax=Stigmatella erecta TaxID=83460 RepID=A0A1I0KRQ8_9BACT|nr:helix-turn-helix transcriptional regulator [Stigmatella erecta]SEU28308.1 AraC-type DNA-binding protein [Stigmatella erecta]
MRSADGVDDYLRDPIGRYLMGDGFLHWYAEEDLCGFSLWGRPAESQVRRLIEVLDVEKTPRAPHASLVDARWLEAPDPSAFTLFVKYMQQREREFASSVVRQALVRPEGLVGATVGGFYSLLSPSYPSKVFTSTAEAMAWLGLPETRSAPLLAEIQQLIDVATGQAPVLQELHRVLRPRLVNANLADTAREMGMSERTLQRRLKEAGTSFQAELNAVQVRTAQALLLETDMKLTAVAVDVGCASLQHFSSLFRKLVGESPSTWRDQHRHAPAPEEAKQGREETGSS